jgi:hypothetical protein
MSKERKLKAFLQLVSVQGRIAELKRSKTYYSSSNIYRNRLTALEEEELRLTDIVEDTEKKDKETFKLTFRVPENLFKGKHDDEDVIQYLKREYLVKS